jgi:hypothetical protein
MERTRVEAGAWNSLVTRVTDRQGNVGDNAIRPLAKRATLVWIRPIFFRYSGVIESAIA